MAWRAAQSLVQLRNQINQLAPHRLKSSDGTIGDTSHETRASDHNPWVKDGSVGVVTAIDITDDPDHGCDAASIVAALVDSRDRRIKYVIWNRQIVSAHVSPWIWRAYSGSNPHTRHFHLSVEPEKPLFDATDPWSVAH